MRTSTRAATRHAGCAAALGLLLTGAAASAEEAQGTNQVDFTMGGVSRNGSVNALSRRVGNNGDFYGGISNLFWQQEKDGVTYSLNGHALYGMEDYGINLRADKEGLGYLELGYEQFRTWYGNTGGYLPQYPATWVTLPEDDLHLDRGTIWLEGGLRLENLPAITARYEHGWRQGEKDSLFWGRGSGLAANYSIVPAINQIDETRDAFSLDLADTYGKTDLELGLRYEVLKNDDYRRMNDTNAGNNLITQHDNYDADLFNTHVSSVTRFNDQMMLTFGYSLTTMDSDIDGSTRSQTIGIGRHDFTPVVGGGQYKTNAASLNFWWNPLPDLVIVPSIRAEWTESNAHALFDEPGEALIDVFDETDTDYDELAEQIDLRYTGIEDILLYTRLFFSQASNDTDYEYTEVDNSDPMDPVLEDGFRYKRSDIDQQKYLVGANWYPLSNLSFSTQYFHQIKEVESDNVLDVDTDAHLGDLQMVTDDFCLRMTWHALSNLMLVTRYDYQQSTIETQGIDGTGATLPTIESADITRHIISESLSYVPCEDLVLQATLSYAMAVTDGPAVDQAPLRLTTSDNDYIVATLTANYTINERTDVTAGYTYYCSQNFNVTEQAPGVPGTTPYGTDLEEHVFSVMLNRQLTPNMLWTMGYSYYNSNDGTSGGNNNFDAHMVSTGLQIRF